MCSNKQINKYKCMLVFISPYTNWNWMQVWFQNRRAKFRKQERLAQQKASSNAGDGSPATQTNIKAENNGSSKSSLGSKDVKPGSPHSGISTTPNSNTSVSSHQSSNGDVKPMNGNGKLIIFFQCKSWIYV